MQCEKRWFILRKRETNSTVERIKSDHSVRNIYSTKMNESRLAKKDKKQHIQVFVRVRPLNITEKSGKSMTVVDTPSNKEIVVRERPHDKFTKKFTFDKVFGSLSKQIEVYDAVVRPLVAEVLAGYNCTIFAYGQTGSGKTFTMEGYDNNALLQWQADNSAGIIPRALSHLFDELRTVGTSEYTVRVSFLELYNEEVYDLLSSNDDAAKIRIYEDSTKKGAVIVHGLEEVIIHNKSEVFKILQKGLEKRQTAATLMNAHSSRSHTIFSITIHIKENSIDGEELLKTGKLNLVDLAGSENIGRSGAVDKRAREAGNINQSLLTLGRVITALVEKTPHVPYRESKLTRLLQESLGGRTRTSIIATISPASINLEETLSTLDYAHRAKNITNRPEINQKFSKKALLQEYTEEIDKLKKDLLASRERNGVYLAPDSYNEMQSLIDFQNKEIEEKLNHIKALQDTLNYKEQIFNELKSENSDQTTELINVKCKLQNTTNALVSVASSLTISEQEKEEQKHLVKKHASTENILISEVQAVLNAADTAATDVHKLHDKIFRKTQIAQRNSSLGQQFKNNIKRQFKEIEADVLTHMEGVVQCYASIQDRIGAETLLLGECIDKSIQDISGKLVNPTQNMSANLAKNINDSQLKYQQMLENEVKNLTTMTEQACNILNNVCSKIAQEIQQSVDNNLAKNLQYLNDDVSQKIDNFTELTQNSITFINESSTQKCDYLNRKVQDILENSEDIRQSQNIITEQRIKFVKLMGDLQRCFNELQEEEEENHSSIHDTLSNIDGVCNIIDNENSNTRKMNIIENNNLQEKLQHDLEIVKQTVSEETGKSRIEAENAILRSKALISEFQADLSKNCYTLTNYQNCVERNIRNMQKKMKEDKSQILSSINDVYKMVYNASDEYINSLDTCKAAFINVSAEMNQKLESEVVDIENINSRMVAEIQGIRDRVDKFFVEDLYRDVSTGSTPAKKNFQFSKKLVKTSPHERILERYRQTLRDIENAENEPTSQLNNNAIEEIEETSSGG